MLEAFCMHASSSTLPVCDSEVDGSVLPSGDAGKCLGYWWKGDLSASRSVEENIQKARRAFFQYGSIGVSKVTSVLYHVER